MPNDWWMETVKTDAPPPALQGAKTTSPPPNSAKKPTADMLLETVSIQIPAMEEKPMNQAAAEEKLAVLDMIFPLSEKKAFLAMDPPMLCFESGQAVIRRGEKHRILYLLVQGELTVRRPELQTPIATLKPGEFFGEMSFFNPSPRHTDVIAETRSMVMKLDIPFFEALPLTVRDKIKDRLIETLVHRLADMNDSLVKIARFAQTHTV